MLRAQIDDKDNRHQSLTAKTQTSIEKVNTIKATNIGNSVGKGMMIATRHTNYDTVQYHHHQLERRDIIVSSSIFSMCSILILVNVIGECQRDQKKEHALTHTHWVQLNTNSDVNYIVQQQQQPPKLQTIDGHWHMKVCACACIAAAPCKGGCQKLIADGEFICEYNTWNNYWLIIYLIHSATMLTTPCRQYRTHTHTTIADAQHFAIVARKITWCCSCCCSF